MLRIKPDEVKVIERAAQGDDRLPLDPAEHRAYLSQLSSISLRLREELDLLLALISKTSINESDAEVTVDADTRHIMFSFRPLLALEEDDQSMVLPWYFLKEAVAQILNYEVWQEEVRCKAEGVELPHGVQHKKIAAQQILKEAQVEKQAFIDQFRGEPTAPPAPRIQIPGLDY